MDVQLFPAVLSCSCRSVLHQLVWLVFITWMVFLHFSWLQHSTLSPQFGQLTYSRSGENFSLNMNMNTSTALKFEGLPKVLCWVMTHQENHERKAAHVRNTWGSRCHKLVFVSSIEDEELGAIKLDNVREGHSHLWSKTIEAFKYLWTEYGGEYDWFLKSDDDTYVVVENLRRFLESYDFKEAIWFGFRLKQYSETGYMSGGSGYVLSREALRKLVKLAAEKPFACPSPNSFGAEDVNMGICMKNAEVKFGDSRDSQGRQRFIFLNPRDLLEASGNRTPLWAAAHSFYPLQNGENCCSDTAIAFHYVDPMDMYLYDYLIYRVNPVKKQLTESVQSG